MTDYKDQYAKDAPTEAPKGDENVSAKVGAQEKAYINEKMVEMRARAAELGAYPSGIADEALKNMGSGPQEGPYGKDQGEIDYIRAKNQAMRSRVKSNSAQHYISTATLNAILSAEYAVASYRMACDTFGEDHPRTLGLLQKLNDACARSNKLLAEMMEAAVSALPLFMYLSQQMGVICREELRKTKYTAIDREKMAQADENDDLIYSVIEKQVNFLSTLRWYTPNQLVSLAKEELDKRKLEADVAREGTEECDCPLCKPNSSQPDDIRPATEQEGAAIEAMLQELFPGAKLVRIG